MTTDDLTPGTRVHHRTRDEHGVFVDFDDADPSGATAWIDFGDDEIVMVSTYLLDAAPL